PSPGGLQWAPMAFMSRFSRSSSRSPSRGSQEDTSNHSILSVFELERLLYTGKTACNHADEVWPGLYLGDQDIAANRRELARLHITHILNASHSKWRGGAEYYEGTGIRYLGIEAHDSPSFDMSPYFHPSADFIHQALSKRGGEGQRRGWRRGSRAQYQTSCCTRTEPPPSILGSAILEQWSS
uniref:Dual specificity protein phosphatase n=1 Tax=Chelonoidis abingdonii TaxID=106734 RepID=A0A8C0IWP4_CHEAB